VYVHQRSVISVCLQNCICATLEFVLQVKRESIVLQQKQSDASKAQEQLSIQRADISRKELELAFREDQISQKLQVSAPHL
jgi:hypothetical protein